MVVHNLNVIGATVTPPKADAPLVVDANTVLTSPLPLECFKQIARRYTKIVQPRSDVNLEELAPRGIGNVGKALNQAVVKEGLGVSVAE